MELLQLLLPKLSPVDLNVPDRENGAVVALAYQPTAGLWSTRPSGLYAIAPVGLQSATADGTLATGVWPSGQSYGQ